MNKKKIKRQKTKCNSSNKEPGQEVLVLPPNLLQKLGINLGKMYDDQNSSRVLNGDAPNSMAKILSNEKLLENDINPIVRNKETSIIETANLMKKSVFLSPTFNNSQSVTLPNSLEVEYSSSIEKQAIIENMFIDRNVSSKLRTKTHLGDYGAVIDQGSENTTIIIDPNLKQCNESQNRECVYQTESSNNKNKINILSEEVVNPMKLGALGPLIEHDRKSLVPVPIDSFISVGKNVGDKIRTVNNDVTLLQYNKPETINSSYLSATYGEDKIMEPLKLIEMSEVSKSEIAKLDISTETFPVLGNELGKNIHEEYNRRNKNIPSEANAVEDFKNCHQEKCVHNHSTIYPPTLRKDDLKNAAHNINNNQDITSTLENKLVNQECFNNASGKNIQLDSIETISNILFEHANKEKQKKIGKNTVPKKFFSLKQSQVKSKLLVQGVEKPGGEIKLNLNLHTKTYARNRKNIIVKKISNKSELQHDDMNLQIDYAVNISDAHMQSPEQFCVCFDFGYLDNNINFINYTHPHFCISQNNCPLDLVLSIYQDENDIINRVDCDDVCCEEISDSECHNICCNAIQLDLDIEREYYLDLHTTDKQTNKTTSVSNTNPRLNINKETNVTEDDNLIQSIEDQRKPAQKGKRRKKEKDESNTLCKKRPKIAHHISNTKPEPASHVKKNHVTGEENINEWAALEESVAPEELVAPKGLIAPEESIAPKESVAPEESVAPKESITPEESVAPKESVAPEESVAQEESVAPEVSVAPEELVAPKESIASKETVEKFVAPKESVNDRLMAEIEMAVCRCAVCGVSVPADRWLSHAADHAYRAWADGQTPLDLKDDEAVYNHLYRISKDIGGLKCSKCGRRRKYVKAFLNHVKSCDGGDKVDTSVNDSLNQSTVSLNNTTDEKSIIEALPSDEVACGVCEARVLIADWSEHARTVHGYLAWTYGQTPLETSKTEAVELHLKQILKEAGDLTCGKCNVTRRTVKSYLRHIGNCDASDETVDKTMNDTLDSSQLSVCESRPRVVEEGSDDDEKREVGCGVCGARVRRTEWSEHASTEHNYLAWRDDQKPLDIDNEEEVFNHLSEINKKNYGLKCNKCGKTRKYVKMYLTHIKTCDAISLRGLVKEHKLDVFECAICNEKVEPSNWNTHAMDKHYNIAWVVGENPIDVKNPLAVEKYLKDYKKRYNKLVCKECGAARASCAGFYAHIIQCGKTDEETEMYKSMCDICNNKYLCIYKSQHMTMHREQENAKQRKLLGAERQQAHTEQPAEVTGRRRAAEKAKSVIEKYNKSIGDNAAGDDVDEDGEQKGRDSDGSAEFDSDSSSSSEFDSNLESDQSAAEQETQIKKKKKKYPDPLATNIKRIPFKVDSAKAFLAESAADFRAKYLSRGVLFERWRRCSLAPVPASRADVYMPAQRRSCKLMIGTEQWTTYDRFEARVGDETSFFVGGCIQWIAWVPPRVGDEDDRSGNFLAVACHRQTDAPRLDATAVYEHPSSVQIWNLGDMTSTPELSLCIALDCGTAWAAAWCPSGARDRPQPRARLGLLAVACSSGAAYILPVPYPDTDISSDKLLHKIKPVAELRFSRGERERYQATSITWSLDKGHSVVVVGYADGSLGYYNIDCDLPLLTDEEDGVAIFYPYDEEQRHYSCVTELTSMAGGVVCSASQTGACVRLRGAAVRSILPATHVMPLPHWPAAFVAGNDLIVNQAVNELECWGAGRRLGSLQCCGGCECCGAVAAVTPPKLRLLRLHPAHHDIYKKDIATIQMRRLDKKTPKIKNDGISVVIEPRTFEDAVKTYGVEFTYNTGRTVMNKTQCCERFPLAEAVGVSFCPAPAHHKRLAVALYCGVVILLTV